MGKLEGKIALITGGASGLRRRSEPRLRDSAFAGGSVANVVFLTDFATLRARTA